LCEDRRGHAAGAQVRQLGDLIEDIRIAMLSTINADGSLHSRPMAPTQVAFDGDLWFFTGADAPKEEEGS
jgi:general stress protein 26